MTAGLSAASFSWIASACGTRPPPPSPLPVCHQQEAEVAVADRQVEMRNSVTAGLSSASFCGSPAPAVLGLRLRRLARLVHHDADAA